MTSFYQEALAPNESLEWLFFSGAKGEGRSRWRLRF
jgi:hypothetical protein